MRCADGPATLCAPARACARTANEKDLHTSWRRTATARLFNYCVDYGLLSAGCSILCVFGKPRLCR